MERKEFLRNICVTGVCACSGSAFLGQKTALAEETDPGKEQEDWRIGFSRQRFTKFTELVQTKLSEQEFNEIIHELGRYCSANTKVIQQYKGDLDGYFKEIKRRWNEDASVDPESGIITIASEKRTACFCPLIDTEQVSEQVCNCSLGWQQQTFETLTGKEVEVALKESVIRGGERCTFEIKILA